MRFQPVKCNMMQLTRKHSKKIQASYTLEGAVLENVVSIKYLGVTITNDLRWNTHISNICTKANRTLGFLRRTLFSCRQNVKEAASKSMVHPILEYGSSVWDPHPDKLQEELEKVQNRATRFVTRNYVYETGSMTGILGQLKWETPKKRRKDNRLILLYKGLKGKARIPTDDLIPKTRRGRNQHSLAFQIPSASKDVYMYSFFPQTIRDWNNLPESLISSSELSDDSVSKFTSLVRARDYFPGSGTPRPKTISARDSSAWTFRPIFQSGTPRPTSVGPLGQFYFIHLFLFFFWGGGRVGGNLLLYSVYVHQNKIQETLFNVILIFRQRNRKII